MMREAGRARGEEGAKGAGDGHHRHACCEGKGLLRRGSIFPLTRHHDPVTCIMVPVCLERNLGAQEVEGLSRGQWVIRGESRT